LVAFGDSSGALTNVPPLPPHVVYTELAVGSGHTVALRSDGQAVSFGYNQFGEGTIPPPPVGQRYVDVDVHYGRTLLLRSDGAIVYRGMNMTHPIPGYVYPSAPLPPPGLRYTQIAQAESTSVALRSDGQVIPWGLWSGAPIPPLPWGVSYVEVDGGGPHVVLRRSDGQVVVAGNLDFDQDRIPVLDAGSSYVEVSAGVLIATAARVGPTSTYVSFAPGCAGSRPASRLVPDDTPRIGKTLNVRIFDVADDLLVLAFGWGKQPSPVSLGLLGMSGCSLHVDFALLLAVAGENGQAVWSLPIPDDPIWVGVHFVNQALVFDHNAGNPFGAVMSDAAEGVIGHW
jgi:hypothetical protein